MLDCVVGHKAFVYDRGGKQRLYEVKQISLIRWGRVRDDISESTIMLEEQSCSTQKKFLNAIEPGRHEIAIYRGEERVWEGPIVRLAYSRGGMEIHSRDVMQYLYRTAIEHTYSSAYPNIETVVGRAVRIIQGELVRKEALTPPVNILPWLTPHHFPNEARTTRVSTPYQMTVFEQIDNLAAKSGIDYTTIGRAIHLWDTSREIGRTRTVTENDFLGELYVSVYGLDLATRTVVTDGVGGFGIAGGTDPYYGEWDVIATAYDETEEPTAVSIELLAEQAQRNLNGRNPTPLQVRIPDNSSLNPKGVLSITDLVPGVHIPLRATLPIRTVAQMQKLKTMQVEETATGEDITITMYPAPLGTDEEIV